MRVLGAVFAVLIASLPAFAGASCTLSARSGTIAYDSLNPAGVRVSGLIEIDCSPSSLPGTARILFDGGGSGNSLGRRMRGGASALAYRIYLPGGGASSGAGETQTVSTALTSQRTLVPFIISIFPHQPVPAGAYMDELSITFSY
ncbi:MAG: spore coat protein U domain-containing protein [Candidatus Velthaea sp.]|jgi:spore coat protein U-like protein